MVELTDFQIEAAALAGIGGGSARSDSEAGGGSSSGRQADGNVANPAADDATGSALDISKANDTI